jgi:hypothetical protein
MHMQIVHYAFIHMVMVPCLVASLQLLYYGFMYGFFLRHGVNVSYTGHEHGEHQCNLIMYHNTLNFYLFLRNTMVGHNFPLDKCHHLLSQVVLLERW